jgi:hydrogenase maturation protease
MADVPARIESTQEPQTLNGDVEARPRRVLVVGLGNPILGDDGVGWRVADQVEARLPADQAIRVERLSLGGLSLMERMLDYEAVVLVDAMWSGMHAPGTVTVHSLDELPNPAAGHTTAAHDASLRTALQAAHDLGAATPQSVKVVAIETRTSYEFSEELNPEVEAAVPIATRKVLDLLAAPP